MDDYNDYMMSCDLKELNRELMLWLKEIKKHLQPHPKIKEASIIEIDNELLKRLDQLLVVVEMKCNA